MLDKLLNFCREYHLVSAGQKVICAVSGGADSMALLWGMYLLREKLGITLACAHYNHGLRGEESYRDEAFVRQFCQDYHIPFHCGRGMVTPGKKGLEAAAREARYGYFAALDGVIATAHTANDNAETVLLHMLRGTGLKGLGGITPKNGNVIRPMLAVTREEVLDFLREYSISYVVDSTNMEDDFLRNRLRHKVMPLLLQENPQFAQNTSRMALRLREDEDYLSSVVPEGLDVPELRNLHPAIRSRAIQIFLAENGIHEPGERQIGAVEAIVFSEKPSASVSFPGGLSVRRSYDKLMVNLDREAPEEAALSCPGEVTFDSYRITARYADGDVNTRNCFAVTPRGQMVVRSRKSGDSIQFDFGTKSLKKLFIDNKIPAHLRALVPVIADEDGVLGVAGFGRDMHGAEKGGPLVEITVTPDIR